MDHHLQMEHAEQFDCLPLRNEHSFPRIGGFVGTPIKTIIKNIFILQILVAFADALMITCEA